MIGPLPDHLRRAEVERLYAEHDYLSAYRLHTDMRARHNHRMAPGPMWEEIGAIQFEYLVSNGLTPDRTLLDIGCCTLRGGRHFIRHLNAGNYSGFDLSPGAIAAARKLVHQDGLLEKRPRLFVNRGGRLTFPYSVKYDFLLAQSVFTHLPAENIEEAFTHVGGVMHRESMFFFTFDDPAEFERRTTLFPHPYGFFAELAKRHGLAIEQRFDYPHPLKQSMAVLKLQPVVSHEL